MTSRLPGLSAALLPMAALAAFSTHGEEGVDRWSTDKALEAVRAAIPQAESDPTRPVFHFRPPAQWMNDICGAIHYNGYYHIFYQYDPFTGDRWGDDYTAWAHARSKDLVHWEDLPWAFVPMKDRGERRCNSGSVALDGNGKPMAFYTFVPERSDATRLGKREQWGVKPLDDDLIRWERVGDAPLMAAGMNGVPTEVNAGWSDPFVFRSDGRTFVTFKSCDGVVCEAEDRELTNWTYAGRMDGVDGECPNFFPLGDKWVLLRSTAPPTYVIGDFDAKRIAFDMNGPQGVLDYGFGKNPPDDRAWTRGLYATNTFVDADGRCVMVGWVCGFKPGRGWNGCMSIPRILSLNTEGNLVQAPAPELETLRGKHTHVGPLELTAQETVLNDISGDTLEVAAVFTHANGPFGLRLRCNDTGQGGIGVGWADGVLSVAGTEVPVPLTNRDRLKLRIFLDKSVVEVFINDGPASVTRVDYAPDENVNVSVFAEEQATLMSLDAWEMRPIW
ncbi:MAG: glycoside hydrolase family 32 protein [bacterium]|nr:glycoside hydrolase family 32 protein [bacterium]